MKRILIILSLVCVFIMVNSIDTIAQRGRLKTLAVDTLKGNNDQTLGVVPITGSYESLFISVKIDRISTAAGGTLYLKSGTETASVLVNDQSTNPNLGFAPNDTLATADVATQYWNIYIPKPEATLYHIFGDGDANDTVKVTTKYYIK